MEFQKLKLSYLTIVIVSFIAFSCGTGENKSSDPSSVITEAGFDKHISVLSSDEYEGRGPFSPAEAKTINYLKDQFIDMGLEPGNGDSYFQDVPVVNIKTEVPETFTISGNGQDLELTYREDFTFASQWMDDEITVENSELVYAGYGVVAPEYGWNDYEGVDVKGKTVVVLVNDPGFGLGDTTLFKGDAMTYYGRWTYKYEEAARQGAKGVLIVHNTVPAGYPWQVVRNSWSGESLYLTSEDGNHSSCALEGWVTNATARKLFDMAGEEFAEFRSMARSGDFKAKPMGLSYSVTMKNTWEENVTKNVAAVQPGTDLKDEYIIYSAHWDHLGIGPANDGDSIYNGAHDNASGTAGVLEIAKAFANLETKPKRSVLFLIVTAEEQGLLGSAYYAENPIYPLEKSVANINIDGLHEYGELKDLTIVGYGQSDMDDYAREEAQTQGRYILEDQEAGKGYFFRSDHFSFAKVGIPALYAYGDVEHMDPEKGKEYVAEKKLDYLTNSYHLPADEYNKEEWDLSGMVFDSKLLFNIGLKISNESSFPKWKEGSEFKAIREAYMN